MNKFKYAITTSIIAAILLASCVPQRIAPMPMMRKPVESFTVEFVVTGGGAGLQMFTPNQGCGKADNGCVRVSSADSADITIKFQNNQVYPCASHPNSYYISKIELSNFPKTFGGAVAPWVKTDFPAVDEANGEIFTGTSTDPKSSVVITDLNTQKGVVWYQIKVRRCSGGADIPTDPRFENEG